MDTCHYDGITDVMGKDKYYSNGVLGKIVLIVGSINKVVQD